MGAPQWLHRESLPPQRYQPSECTNDVAPSALPRSTVAVFNRRMRRLTVVNAQRKFIEVSPSFCKLLGYPREELVGKLFDDFTVPYTVNIVILWRLIEWTQRMVGIWVYANIGAGTNCYSSATRHLLSAFRNARSL